jgi:hypothetical protein
MAVSTIKPVAPKAAKGKDLPTGVFFNPSWKPAKAKAEDPTFATLAVGPHDKGGEPGVMESRGLAGSLPKWVRLFGLDKDGDSVLAGVFGVLYQVAETDEARKALIDSVGLMVEQVNQFLATVEQGVEEPEAPKAKPAPTPPAKPDTIPPAKPDTGTILPDGKSVKTSTGKVVSLKWSVSDLVAHDPDYTTFTADELADSFGLEEPKVELPKPAKHMTLSDWRALHVKQFGFEPSHRATGMQLQGCIESGEPYHSTKEEDEEMERKMDELAAKMSPAPAKPAVTIVKSDRHIGGSEKHYRENVHRALAALNTSLEVLPDDATRLVVKKSVEDMVRAAWKALKYADHPRMF